MPKQREGRNVLGFTNQIPVWEEYEFKTFSPSAEVSPPSMEETTDTEQDRTGFDMTATRFPKSTFTSSGSRKDLKLTYQVLDKILTIDMRSLMSNDHMVDKILINLSPPGQDMVLELTRLDYQSSSK